MSTQRKLSRTQQKEIKTAIARANRTDKKELSAQDSIPYLQIRVDGICQVTPTHFTKTIQFRDINYQLSDNEDKQAIFDGWCDFLNYFDSSIKFQFSFVNLTALRESFARAIPLRSDQFESIQRELSKIIHEQQAKGNNGIVKTKYLTFGIDADNIRSAKPRLERIETDILNNFKRLWVSAEVLNGQERLRVLHDILRMDAADTVDSSAHVLQKGYRSAKLQPYRAAARAEKQLERANIHALQKKAEVEHPASNPLSRWRQKQAIKRQYAAQKAGCSTVEGSARAAKEAAKKSEQAVTLVARHRKGFAAVLGILLILAFLLNAVSSCSMMVEGIGAGIAAGSYAAADDDIVGAEAAYCAMEQALQQKLDHYEQTHDYDEYHYALDDIGHDPYVLTAILSAMHPGEWKLLEVMGTLEMLFEKQYILTETVESETRYRTETVTGERHARDPVTGAYLYDQWGYPIMEEYEYKTQVPYTYRSVTVKLENFDLSHVPVYVMNEETLGRYALYMATLGNRPDLFPDSDYIRQMLIEGYTKYDLPPEALENARFAAMIKEAEKYLGYPYVWGGSNPSTSFDCSGFVCWVLNHSGWRVGRTSAQGLYNLCTPVSRSNARPGDLVFFKDTYKTNGVSHVGIYVGENRMIHCGNPISYTNINTQYWQSHFFTFGRLP